MPEQLFSTGHSIYDMSVERPAEPKELVFDVVELIKEDDWNDLVDYCSVVPELAGFLKLLDNRRFAELAATNVRLANSEIFLTTKIDWLSHEKFDMVGGDRLLNMSGRDKDRFRILLQSQLYIRLLFPGFVDNTTSFSPDAREYLNAYLSDLQEFLRDDRGFHHHLRDLGLILFIAQLTRQNDNFLTIQPDLWDNIVREAKILADGVDEALRASQVRGGVLWMYAAARLYNTACYEEVMTVDPLWWRTVEDVLDSHRQEGRWEPFMELATVAKIIAANKVVVDNGALVVDGVRSDLNDQRTELPAQRKY